MLRKRTPNRLIPCVCYCIFRGGVLTSMLWLYDDSKHVVWVYFYFRFLHGIIFLLVYFFYVDLTLTRFKFNLINSLNI